MRRQLAGAAAVLLIVAAGCADSVKHPLDDSETKPANAAAALVEADAQLDEVGAAALAGLARTATEWVAPTGCGTDPGSPEQGDVSRVLRRSYQELPAGSSAADVLAAASSHWEEAGHTVGPGAPNMPQQVITRVNGISYSAVEVAAAVELMAFLPCF